jgi:hypothetical protein
LLIAAAAVKLYGVCSKQWFQTAVLEKTSILKTSAFIASKHIKVSNTAIFLETMVLTKYNTMMSNRPSYQSLGTKLENTKMLIKFLRSLSTTNLEYSKQSVVTN